MVFILQKKKWDENGNIYNLPTFGQNFECFLPFHPRTTRTGLPFFQSLPASAPTLSLNFAWQFLAIAMLLFVKVWLKDCPASRLLPLKSRPPKKKANK